MNPICPFCNLESSEATGADIYPHRKDLKDLKFFVCPQAPGCDARVGRHKKTGEALGTMANSYLREARMLCHEKLDSIWKHTSTTRSEFYQYLSEEMDIPLSETHIGMFGYDECNKAIASYDAIKLKIKNKKLAISCQSVIMFL